MIPIFWGIIYTIQYLCVNKFLSRAMNALLTGRYAAKSVFSPVAPFIFLSLNSYSSWGKCAFGTVLDWKIIHESSLCPPAVRKHYTNYSFSFPVMITCVCFLPILETEIALHDKICSNLVNSAPHGPVCYNKLTRKQGTVKIILKFLTYHRIIG